MLMQQPVRRASGQPRTHKKNLAVTIPTLFFSFFLFRGLSPHTTMRTNAEQLNPERRKNDESAENKLKQPTDKWASRA